MKKNHALIVLLMPVILVWATVFNNSAAFAQNDRPADVATRVVPANTELVSSIQERVRLAPDPEIHERPEMEYPDRSNLPQNPFSPNVASSTVTDQGVTPSQNQSTDQPMTTGLTFNGFSSTSAGGPFPPDNMGAIGPTQYIVGVNGIIKSFSATTGFADGVMNVNPDVFFASVMTPGASTFTSDPRVRYDRRSGKWLIIIIDVPSSGANRVLLAVSNTSTISAGTTWTYSQFTGEAGVFIDYPTIGMDANAVYIGGNIFNLAGTSFLHTNGYVINRANLMAGGAYTVYSFLSLASTGAGPYTPQGVDNFDAAPTQGYFIGVDNASYGILSLRRVSTPAGVPTISANIQVTVSTTSAPNTVPHLGNSGGTSGNLDAIDDRLYAAVIRGGHLWTAHTNYVNSSGVSTSGTRNGVRWYDLMNLATTPTVNQFGTIFDAAASNPKWYFFPSVMVSGQGHAAFSLATAGLATRPNAATTGRLASDGTGTTQTATLTTASATAYNPSGDNGVASGSRRWGDYSYVSLDPLDDMTMWMVNQYCAAANVYGCSVSKLIAPPPAAIASCLPSTVSAGQASVSVTVTGTSASGSGFYDPGANLPAPALAFHHIAAVVSGGVVVNSVTYTDPTHITLSLNTTAAAAGFQTITVTNPDGQSVISGGILKICPVITVTNPANATGTAGAVLSKTFTSAGGSPTVTYSTSSTLPGGVTLSSAGVLSGVPTATGTFPIVVTATDVNGCTGTGTTYNLLISCPVESPAILAGGPTTFCPGGSVQLTSTGGNGLQFAGTGNYVTIPSTINTNFSANRITVEGWYYQTAATVGQPALVGEAFLGDGTVKFTMYLSGSQVVAGFYSGSWITATSTVNMPLNTWTHLAATYDQTAIRIYVNGAAAGSFATAVVLPAGSEEWRMARRWDNAEYFSGRMDEVRIWNVARSQAQIQAGMSAVVPPASSGLIAYYRLDEGTGVNAADLSGHGYSGTFAGSPTWLVPSSAPLTGYSGYLWSNGSTSSGITVTSAGNYYVTVTDPYNCTGISAPVAVTIKSLTGAAGAISGAAVTAQGHIGVTYTVPAIANATGYVWSMPAGASIATGAGTNNITVDFSAAAVSGNITVYGTNDCGNGAVSPSFAVTVIASTYNTGNTVVGSGSAQCYSATQTIYVGGATTFLVENGGSATMIAGQNILYQVGTTAASGAYLHGYITPDNQYCGGMTPTMLTIVAGVEAAPVVSASPFMKVYPNPTTGVFTIELNGDYQLQAARVELFNMNGARVISEDLKGDMKYSLSIAAMPPGLYFLRVVSGSSAETVKLIKL